MATAPDTDAPDWFEPLPGDGNGAAEAMPATAPATRGNSKETPIVHSDNLMPDDDVRGGATTADTEIDIEVVGAEPLAIDDGEPQFDGDIPGFSDWREELRERLKRIRARREQERLTEGNDAEKLDTSANVDEPEADEMEAIDETEAVEETENTEPDTTAEIEGEADLAAAADVDAEEESEVVVLEEDDEVVVEQTEVVGFGAANAEPAADDADGNDLLAESEPVAGVDDPGATEEAVEPVEEPAEPPDDDPEKAAEDDADFDPGEAATDELEPFAEPDTDSEPEISTDEAIERLDAIFDEPSEAAEDLEAGDAGDPAVDPAIDLPPAVMPDLPDDDEPTAAAGDSVLELDFDEAAPVPTPALDLDLPEADAEDDQALEWDEEVVEPATEHSSAGPLGERAAAALCDLLVLTAIGSALVGAASSGTGLPFRQILVEEALGLGITWAIFVIGYSVFFVGSCGQTIGRMVMRLRVVGTDQFSVGFGRAAIRLAAWVVSALPLLAGMLPALRDPQRRGLHDRLSRTRVVKA
ncbi:MAG: RDD family protein [Acidobacteria bacterium]|nr:RDD family protein [Acidobacteriota bacterium]